MNKLMKIFITAIGILLTSVAVAGSPVQSKTEQQLIADQRTAVKTLVTDSQQKVVIAVDGLCCATCGIGVKKKLEKLDFVAKKGVFLDVNNSMAVVTLEEPGVLNRKAMITAIRKAGYKPVRFYQYQGGEATETAISEEG